MSTPDTSVASQDKHPLTTAANLGRYAAAHREILALQLPFFPRKLLDEAAIERVNRIGTKFAGAMRMFKMKPEDLKVYEENKKLNLKWGMKLEGAVLQVVSVAEFDANFLKMVSLDLEGDLEDKINEDDIKQEMFAKPHAHDVSWRKRLIKAGVGTKYDDIIVVSSVDALDEPLKAICSLKYTLDKGATADPYGTPIPAADPGYLPTPYLFTATALTPLGIGGNKMQGVRKFECIEAELPSTVAKIVGAVPNFMLKKLCRGNVEAKVKMTMDVLKNFPELDKRLQVPPRSEFLEQVRSHVAE